jgi:hypothetical protein
MTLQELYTYLKTEDVEDKDIDLSPVELEFKEKTLIQILKDMVDTAWGRGTLDNRTIENWLNNFTGMFLEREYERMLALILAIHIVYYNENDISYLVKIAYRKLLHEIMVKEQIDIEKAAESIVFYPLGSISESGPFLSYYFRKENNLSVGFFANSMEKVANSDKIKSVVLLDDVSISGGQVSWYMKKMKEKTMLWNKLAEQKKFYALFLISTTKAQKKLEEENVYLCSPILMDERSQCFDKESAIYKMFDTKVRDKIRQQSKWMCEKYGYRLLVKQYFENGEMQRMLDNNKTQKQIKQKIQRDALGYDDSEVLIAFEYNTPNNCLPIIWAENSKWTPLFKRYDKLYATKVVGGIENENIYI